MTFPRKLCFLFFRLSYNCEISAFPSFSQTLPCTCCTPANSWLLSFNKLWLHAYVYMYRGTLLGKKGGKIVRARGVNVYCDIVSLWNIRCYINKFPPTWLPRCALNKDDTSGHAKVDRGKSMIHFNTLFLCGELPSENKQMNLYRKKWTSFL